MPGAIDFFSLILNHFSTFFLRKLPPWTPPRLDARGRRTHLHPALHATASMLVSIALSFAFHISAISIHFSSPAIGFHSSIFHSGGICTPPPALLLYPGLGPA